MDNIIKRILEGVLKHRAAAALALALITAFMAYQARGVKIDNSLDIWFISGDPTLANYRHYQDVFGSDERVAVVVESEGGMAGKAGMEYLDKLNEEIKAQDHVSHTVSPTHFTGKKMPDFLFSKDKKAAVIMADMGLKDNMDEVRARGIENIKKAIEKAKKEGFRVSIAGTGVIFDEINRIAGVDFPMLTGLSYIVIIAVMFYVTRSFYTVAFAAAAFTVSLIWQLGIMGLLKMNINMVSMAAPSIVLIIAVENFSHINSHVLSGVKNFRELTLQKITDRMAKSFAPAFIAMATTVVGFVSLVWTKMRIIQEFGIITSLGTAAAFFCTFFIMLFCYAGRAGRDAGITQFAGARDRSGFVRKVMRYKWPIVISTALIFLASVYGILQLKSDTNSLNYLKKSNQVRQDSEHIEKVFGYYMPLDIVIRAKKDLKEELVHGPDLFGRILKFEERVSKMEGVRSGFSLKDVLPLMSGGTVPGHETALKYILSADGKETKVIFQVRMSGSQQAKKIIEDIKKAGAEELGGAMEVIPAGYIPLYVKMMEYIDMTQRQSFSAAFIVIFIVIGFMLKSVRYALLSIFPNVFPIAVVLGAMGYMGLSLDIATVTIASIAIGIVVDDTVHFLYTYKNSGLKTVEGRLTYTFNSTFSAVTGMSLVLGMGFMVFVFSHVKSLIYFGLFTGIIILVGWLADLFIMPATLALKGEDKK